MEAGVSALILSSFSDEETKNKLLEHTLNMEIFCFIVCSFFVIYLNQSGGEILSSQDKKEYNDKRTYYRRTAKGSYHSLA